MTQLEDEDEELRDHITTISIHRFIMSGEVLPHSLVMCLRFELGWRKNSLLVVMRLNDLLDNDVTCVDGV